MSDPGADGAAGKNGLRAPGKPGHGAAMLMAGFRW